MPSLNLKTKNLTYTAADERALESAVTLLSVMVEYDLAAKNDAESARASVSMLLAHVKRQRTK